MKSKTMIFIIIAFVHINLGSGLTNLNGCRWCSFTVLLLTLICGSHLVLSHVGCSVCIEYQVYKDVRITIALDLNYF